MDPYRESPAVALVPVRPLRRRHRGWLWGPAAVIAAGGAIAFGSVVAPWFAGWIAANAVILHVALNASAQRQADRQLRDLPFPIVHGGSSSAWFLPPGQRLARVDVHMQGALDGPAADDAARQAQARAPGIVVRIARDTIELAGWRGRADDIVVLADLLATWGRALHAARPIREVTVIWTTDGPPPSM